MAKIRAFPRQKNMVALLNASHVISMGKRQLLNGFTTTACSILSSMFGCMAFQRFIVEDFALSLGFLPHGNKGSLSERGQLLGFSHASERILGQLLVLRAENSCVRLLSRWLLLHTFRKWQFSFYESSFHVCSKLMMDVAGRCSNVPASNSVQPKIEGIAA